MGSPRTSDPILSTSSSISSGLRVSQRCSEWMMRPGSAPTYVRRCPRTSASSRTPPSDTRVKRRSSASAMLWPSDVFPTPGGPTKHRMLPFACGLRVRTARYSRMRSFTVFRS